MMGRILNLNKEVFTFHEIHFFEQLWSSQDRGKIISLREARLLFAKLLKTERIGYLIDSDSTYFLEEALVGLKNYSKEDLTSENVFQIFLNYEAGVNGKTIGCDQTPRNILYASDILNMYPQAKIINMIRDPRDILLSQKNKWKRKFLGASGIPYKESFRSWVNYHPITISKLWSQNVSCAEKLLNHPRFLCVKFEELLTNQEKEVNRICQFIGIEFNSEMLSVPQIGSSGSSDVSTKMGINPDKSENWRKGGLTQTEIFFSERIAGNTMKIFNYSMENSKPNIFSLSMHIITFPAKLVTSLMMNLHRMKNIGESLKRRLLIR